MENSYNSSIKKHVSNHDHDCDDEKVETAVEDCSQEESGWTAYFQDFSNNNEMRKLYDESQEEMSFSCTSSSLVSDAASYAAWKIYHYNNNNNDLKAPKKLNFKKTRAKVISEDDSLEDTASSPVNSPKVCDTIKTKTQTEELIIDHSISMGKKSTSSECYSELHPQERSIVDFNGKNECIDLKKRGLCLVPLSMLVNYLG